MIRTTTQKQDSMREFVRQLEKSRKASQSASRSAQKQTFAQSPDLTPFTPEQRAGRAPTKD